jgi:hypothetical protein
MAGVFHPSVGEGKWSVAVAVDALLFVPADPVPGLVHALLLPGVAEEAAIPVALECYPAALAAHAVSVTDLFAVVTIHR